MYIVHFNTLQLWNIMFGDHKSIIFWLNIYFCMMTSPLKLPDLNFHGFDKFNFEAFYYLKCYLILVGLI